MGWGNFSEFTRLAREKAKCLWDFQCWRRSLILRKPYFLSVPHSCPDLAQIVHSSEESRKIRPESNKDVLCHRSPYPGRGCDSPGSVAMPVMPWGSALVSPHPSHWPSLPAQLKDLCLPHTFKWTTRIYIVINLPPTSLVSPTPSGRQKCDSPGSPPPHLTGSN